MERDALLALIGKLEKWALFFGILVAIGVAGESVYGIRLYWNNRKLQEIQNREAVDQRGIIAQLNNETAKLESIVAGRNLKPEEIAALGKSLKRFAGHTILVGSYTGDAEGARLGMQLKAALDLAQITVVNRIGNIGAEPGGVFLGVGVSGELSERDTILAISDALASEAHLSVTAPQILPPLPTASGKSHPLGISVGMRPFSTNTQ
jgi:hypothetical protein